MVVLLLLLLLLCCYCLCLQLTAAHNFTHDIRRTQATLTHIGHTWYLQVTTTYDTHQ